MKIPPIARGCIVPHSVQKELYKKEQERKEQKKALRNNFIHDTIITIISVVLSSIDKIVILAINL